MKSFRCFAVLAVLALGLAASTQGQKIPYGSNEAVAHRVDVGDAKIYYETYGEGPPLLLLHGGLYGYIDEFSAQIPVLSQHFKVIAVATRGHGRSEIGTKPYSYRLFADDARAILQRETDQPAIVIGFSDGARAAYFMAAVYPQLIRKVVAIGCGLRPTSLAIAWASQVTAEKLQRDSADFVAYRQRLMPNPERWDDFLEKLKAAYLTSAQLTDEQAKEIQCPVLIVGGDHDTNNPVKSFEQARDAIPHAQLVIVPDAGHVDALQRPSVLSDIVMPFVLDRATVLPSDRSAQEKKSATPPHYFKDTPQVGHN
jgi:pimeloyl-ACP methyl ester carboxylesterase